VKKSLGIIADDYTGALMVACSLEAAGLRCPLVFDPEASVAGAPVIVAGTRTRTVAVDEAVAEVKEVADAFTQAGYTHFAYKTCATFDSTSIGNIGPAADFLADREGKRPVLLGAGFPLFNTTTHNGYLFYRGRLVSESIKRLDPLTPMSDPDLVRFLSLQTRHSVGLISHLQMQKGPEYIAKTVDELVSKGNGHVFFDMSDDDDIEIAARFAVEKGYIVAASDPLVISYAKLLLSDRTEFRPSPQHVQGAGAVLAGTVGPVILEQLEIFSQKFPVLSLDIADPRDEDAIVEESLKWSGEHVGVRPFAISTATNETGVERAQANYGPLGAARRAERVLGSIARGLRDRGIRRFVVAGGETSGAVVSALGIKAVRAFPEGLVGAWFCVTDDDDPVSLCLKPGKLGAGDILLSALDHMC
jgi:uncharacterized protein YgbK (DUF1537 family)